MPFKSEKQRRFLWAEHPEIAKRWAHEYPTKKKLPMYANKAKDDTTEKSAYTAALTFVNRYVNNCKSSRIDIANTTMSKTDKTADSKQERVDIPHSSKPVYAGEERAKGQISSEIPTGMNVGEGCGDKPKNAINDLLTKLSVVLSPHIEQTLENMRAEREGRVARRIGRNRGIKQYPVGGVNILPPMGLAQAPAQSQQSQPNNQYPTRPVGGGSHPQFNPINAFGALSTTGVINGNAAFGAKNSPDSSKTAEVIKHATRSEALTKLMDLNTVDPLDVDYYSEEFEEELAGRKAASSDSKTDKHMPCSCGCGDTVQTCKCSQSCSCRKPGGSCYKPSEKKVAVMEKYSAEYVMKIARCWAGYEPVPGKKPFSEDSCRPVGSGKKKKKKDESKSEKEAGTPAWQRSEGKNEAGGLNEKGRKSYEREHGGNLKAPVTQKNPKGEAKKRQNSFCSRMCGMKRVNTGAKTKSDPDSRINKSLRKWNCKCSSAMEFGLKLAAAPFALGPTTNPNDPRVQLGNLVGPQQTQAYQQRVQRGTTAMNQLMGRGQTNVTPAAGGGAPTVRSALLGGTRGAVGQSLFPGPK